ncbi:hypothetical protein [Halomonas sp. WWR20]
MSQRLFASLIVMLWLVGCASVTDRPQTVRQALHGLSQRAADELLTHPPWSSAGQEVVLLVVAPDVDEALGISTERFREALTRALLAAPEGPQVLDGAPGREQGTTPDNQWLLTSQLHASGPALGLSDRTLQPYQLEMTLRRLGEHEPGWQRRLTGAFDTSAL